MIYTGKGDNRTMMVFGCDQRISKSSAIAEALGALDEINSFLGLCKVNKKAVSFKLSAVSYQLFGNNQSSPAKSFHHSSRDCWCAKINRKW